MPTLKMNIDGVERQVAVNSYKDSPCNNCPPDRRCDECNVGLYIVIK